jgi:hypothetical protein
MGLYPYRTFTEMGKRITKIGLAEPITLEDGRTKSYTGYQWVDHDGEGVTLLPWGSGDQVIRLKDNRGYYVEPINEATADMAQCRQTLTWRKVHQYPQLPYERNLEWCDVPLLESSDPMTEKLDCERCHQLFSVEPWPFIVDGPLSVFDHRPKKPKKYKVPGTGKRFCLPCREAQNHSRVEAAAQGWNHDTGEQFPLPPQTPEWLKAKSCEHRWGTQVSGTPNVPGQPKTLNYRFECILCGEPTPDEHLTQQQRELAREQLDRDYYRARS